jgi:hypothetical protein
MALLLLGAHKIERVYVSRVAKQTVVKINRAPVITDAHNHPDPTRRLALNFRPDYCTFKIHGFAPVVGWGVAANELGL